jgi:hypothetical protein
LAGGTDIDRIENQETVDMTDENALEKESWQRSVVIRCARARTGLDLDWPSRRFAQAQMALPKRA